MLLVPDDKSSKSFELRSSGGPPAALGSVTKIFLSRIHFMEAL